VREAKSQTTVGSFAARRGPGESAVAPAMRAIADRLGGPQERPDWFDSSIAKVLRHLDTVLAATGPRELEQAVAELTGGEVHRALHVARQGLWFEWWYEELVRAAAERVSRQAAAGGDDWQGPWWLLHGLAAIGSPALKWIAMKAIAEVGHELPAPGSPDWLRLCPDGAVSGDIWTMIDDYQTRFAIIAECVYPGGVDPHVFLLDIDACTAPTVVGGAVHDSLEQATQAWRASKGDAATAAQPDMAKDYSLLGLLVGADVSPNGPFAGRKHRGACDNLLRGNRRMHDIVAAMAQRGHEWSPAADSRDDRDAKGKAMVKAFAAWYASRHGGEPHSEAVEWLAGDWLTWPTPGYEHAVSPHRVRELLAYMDDDWVKQESATQAAYELLPEWVRWNGEKAGIPEHFIERSADAAARGGSGADECGNL